MVLSFWPLESALARLLMILRLATRDIFHILNLLYKMFCAAPEDQTNRRDVPHASRRFITLLNAFNKVLSRLCSDGSTPRRCLCVCTTLITSVVFVWSPVCSILATAPRYCVLLHERQLVQYDEGGGKNQTRPNSQISCSWVRGKCSSREQTLVPVPRAPPGPVHADGTSLPDFIWGNQILPLLPSERRSISSHMSTRFVRLFITINCCSTLGL